MRVLLLNQTFYPDVASSAQHLKDLALGLVERGHEVTDVTSRRAYDDPQLLFPKRERWRGVEIHRIAATGFGKGAKWKRAVDFGSFLGMCALKLATLPPHDVVVALTSPPLISFLGAASAQVRKSKFVYWVMDLNPDEAIQAGWLKAGKLTARSLESISRYSFRRADRIIALDRFMAARIQAKGISSDKIEVIPPWSHDDVVRFNAEGREKFRAKHGLTEKFVVMYSGNHSPCHPLNTLLEGAKELSKDSRFVFCFIGGGSEFGKVKDFAVKNSLPNIVCLPYQPLNELSGSLSAADVHVVVMGDPFVGTIHPCKIYNILSVAAPILYIGPSPSHVTEVLGALTDRDAFATVDHGSVEKVMFHLRKLCCLGRRGNDRGYAELAAVFSRDRWLGQFVDTLERVHSSAL
jgi:glycosyltransferase involved in cell wall biosynthesis